MLILSLLAVPASFCGASEPTTESRHNDAVEHEWQKNHVAAFIGGMAPLNNSTETSLALGLSYERRLTEYFGLEVLADFTIGAHERTALFASGLTYRPFTELGLKLMTGPGFELEQHDGHATKVNFVYGVGAAWEFHIGKVSVAPTVYFDFLGESKTNLTFGLGIGTGF